MALYMTFKTPLKDVVANRVRRYSTMMRAQKTAWPGLSACLLVLLALFLPACRMAPAARLETARAIAAEAGMVQHDIPAGAFLLRSYERVSDRKTKTARIYIEGDGLAWLHKNTPSPDPTPPDPVALSLARADTAANVIYLARPCQYNVTQAGQRCDSRNWTSARFSAANVAAMSAALDDIRQRYGFEDLELVGFSGGAAIAVILAAQRSDVVTLRTVAGNLDSEAFNRFHDVSPMPLSLNPVDFARKTANIPQRHFLAGRDAIVPRSLYENYRSKSGGTPCVAKTTVPDADHQNGWRDRWSSLLKIPFPCAPDS